LKTVMSWVQFKKRLRWLFARPAELVALKGGKRQQRCGYRPLLWLMVGISIILAACQEIPTPAAETPGLPPHPPPAPTSPGLTPTSVPNSTPAETLFPTGTSEPSPTPLPPSPTYTPTPNPFQAIEDALYHRPKPAMVVSIKVYVPDAWMIITFQDDPQEAHVPVLVGKMMRDWEGKLIWDEEGDPRSRTPKSQWNLQWWLTGYELPGMKPWETHPDDNTYGPRQALPGADCHGLSASCWIHGAYGKYSTRPGQHKYSDIVALHYEPYGGIDVPESDLWDPVFRKTTKGCVYMPNDDVLWLWEITHAKLGAQGIPVEYTYERAPALVRAYMEHRMGGPIIWPPAD